MCLIPLKVNVQSAKKMEKTPQKAANNEESLESWHCESMQYTVKQYFTEIRKFLIFLLER